MSYLFSQSSFKNLSKETGFSTSFITFPSKQFISSDQIAQFFLIKDTIFYLSRLQIDQTAIIQKCTFNVKSLQQNVQHINAQIKSALPNILKTQKIYHSLRKLSKKKDHLIDKKILSLQKQTTQINLKIQSFKQKSTFFSNFYYPSKQTKSNYFKQFNKLGKCNLMQKKLLLQEKQIFSFAKKKASLKNKLSLKKSASNKQQTDKNKKVYQQSKQSSSQKIKKQTQIQIFQQQTFAKQSHQFSPTERMQLKQSLKLIENKKNLGFQQPQIVNRIQSSQIDILLQNSTDKQYRKSANSSISSPININLIQQHSVHLKPFFKDTRNQNIFDKLQTQEQIDFFSQTEKNIKKSGIERKKVLDETEFRLKETRDFVVSQAKPINPPPKLENENDDEMLQSIQLQVVSKISRNKSSRINDIESPKKTQNKTSNQYSTPRQQYLIAKEQQSTSKQQYFTPKNQYVSFKKEDSTSYYQNHSEGSFSSIKLQAVSKVSRDESQKCSPFFSEEKIQPEEDEDLMQLLRESSSEQNKSVILKRSKGGQSSQKRSANRFSLNMQTPSFIKQEDDQGDC